MRHFLQLLALAGCSLAFGSQIVAAEPAPPASACQASLQQVAAEWDDAGFAAPTKPMQAQVLGRHGRYASGADVTYLANQLRSAAQDCAAGRDAAGLQRIAVIHARLSRIEQ